jgi:hypothetical protein
MSALKMSNRIDFGAGNRHYRVLPPIRQQPIQTDRMVIKNTWMCYHHLTVTAPEAVPAGLSGRTPAITAIAGETGSAMDLVELATDHERLVTPASRHMETRT